MNQTNPVVEIELDKTRHLKLDFAALLALEEKTGVNIFDADSFTVNSPTKLRAMVWCMLIHEDPDLTLVEVGRLIDLKHFAQLAEKVAQAQELAMPEIESKGDETES